MAESKECEIEQIYRAFDELVYVCWIHRRVHVISESETPEGFEFKSCEDFNKLRELVKGICPNCFRAVVSPVEVETPVGKLVFCSEKCRDEYVTTCAYCGKRLDKPKFYGGLPFCSEECSKRYDAETDLDFLDY